MPTYRVAILGCRARGTAIAKAYHAHPRSRVVALCDLRQERLDELGNALGVGERFTDLDRMIREARPDIVVVATGTEFHYELGMRVLEHAVHLDIEKPMCVDLLQADALVAKAREKGVRIAVHHQGRVDAALRAVEKACAEGRIGQLHYMQGSGKGYYGGYDLMNIGTHMLSSLTRIGGRCRRVMACGSTGGRPITPHDVVQSPGGMGTIAGDHLTALLEFDHGLTATLLHHRMPTVDAAAYQMEIYGTAGRIIWRGPYLLPAPHFCPDGTRDRWQPMDVMSPPDYRPESGAAEPDYSYADEYVRALDDGRDHGCSGEEALHVIEIMMGILESAAWRRPVEIPQSRRDHPLLRWRRENGLGHPAPVTRDYGAWLKAEDARVASRPAAH